MDRERAGGFCRRASRRLMQLSTQELQQRGLQAVKEQGDAFIIGVEEVGYGCIAGPVADGAAVVRANWFNSYVRDSKKLDEDVRERLVRDVLVQPDIAFSIVLNHTSQVVDQMGVSRARDDLVARVVHVCRKKFPSALVVMDGNNAQLGISNFVCLPKADDLVKAVSAASILAKVERDSCMKELHDLWPVYGFNSHKGYGTAQHVEALNRHGPCTIHRFSYRNVQEIAEKFGMHVSGYAKPSQIKSQPVRISGWQPLRSGMRVSTSSNRR